jgi:hypothetical protein
MFLKPGNRKKRASAVLSLRRAIIRFKRYGAKCCPRQDLNPRPRGLGSRVVTSWAKDALLPRANSQIPGHKCKQPSAARRIRQPSINRQAAVKRAGEPPPLSLSLSLSLSIYIHINIYI